MKTKSKAKIYKFLKGHRERWTKRALARNKRGLIVNVRSSSAVKFCLLGAILRFYSQSSQQEHACALLRGVTGANSLGTFNDRATFSAVLAAVKDAGI